MRFYYEYRTLILVAAVALPVVFCVVHYLAIGPKGAELKRLPRTVERLSIWDRLVHFLRALTFVLAGFTGYVLAFGPDDPEPGHVVLGTVFAAASVASVVLWYRHSLPRRQDLEWLAHVGGYLSKKPPRLRSAKFNAGQKIFIWLSLAVAVALAATGHQLSDGSGSSADNPDGLLVAHGLLGALAVALVIAHIYLSVWAVPGTWRALINGKVAKEWLAHHHPDDDSPTVDSPRDRP